MFVEGCILLVMGVEELEAGLVVYNSPLGAVRPADIPPHTAWTDRS